jgi:hypothetical protein
MEASLYNSQWFLLFYNNNDRFTYLAASVHTAQYQDLQRPLDPLPPPAKIFSTHWRLAVAANLITTFCSSLTPRSLKKLSVVSKHYASPYIIKWCWCASLKDRPLQTGTIIFVEQSDVKLFGSKWQRTSRVHALPAIIWREPTSEVESLMQPHQLLMTTPSATRKSVSGVVATCKETIHHIKISEKLKTCSKRSMVAVAYAFPCIHEQQILT